LPLCVVRGVRREEPVLAEEVVRIGGDLPPFVGGFRHDSHCLDGTKKGKARPGRIKLSHPLGFDRKGPAHQQGHDYHQHRRPHDNVLLRLQ
jgi:hypothetical protein